MKRTIIIMTAAILLVAALAVGATVAWLSTKTTSVVNTFTVGDINITLTESENLDLKMIPGKEITKDPKVTVLENSEACWLFVKVEKSTNANFDDYMTYEIADGWTELTSGSGIYYREVAASTADQAFAVLKDNKVTVKETVTKTMMNALTEAPYPKMTFTAYAVQKEGISSASDAWAKLGA